MRTPCAIAVGMGTTEGEDNTQLKIKKFLKKIKMQHGFFFWNESLTLKADMH